MKRCGFLPLGVMVALVFGMAQLAGAAEVKIGVLAKDGPAKALSQWESTAAYLTEKVPGSTFSVVPLDFGAVYDAIEGGAVDFFLVNSSMFVTAQARFGANAVATMVNSRQGKPLNAFGGVVFTYANRDDIATLADLKGKRFMAVEETSFGGWQMAYKVLLDKGIDPKSDFASLEFGGKHENVVFAVQSGAVDAGTVRTDTLERMAAAGDIAMDEFKILHQQQPDGFPFVVSTPLYPEWPFARAAKVADALAAEVGAALKAMPADSPAAQAAKVVGWSDPLDYGTVKALQAALGIAAQ